MILAGIDIGTNTFRLLIADAGPGSFQELTSDRRITRLGQDLDRRGTLCPEAMKRSFDALGEFQKSIEKQGACCTSAIGTSALRKAENASVFIDQVRQQTGLVVRVVSGEEEARLTLLGVEQSLAGPEGSRSNALEAAIVMDIGGGSTELMVTHHGEKTVTVSLPLGAVYLTDRFIKHDPPSQEDLTGLRRFVREELEAGARVLQPARNSVCIGTAGAITTLAAIDLGLDRYDPEKINRKALTREFIDAIILKLASLKREERKRVRGLDPGREDIILAGSIIAQEIMHRFGFATLVVSDWGLREGIVIDLFDRLSKKN